MADFKRMIAELEAQKLHIQQALDGLYAADGNVAVAQATAPAPKPNGAVTKKAPELSPEAKKKIAAAQKKRWDAHRKAKAAAKPAAA